MALPLLEEIEIIAPVLAKLPTTTLPTKEGTSDELLRANKGIRVGTLGSSLIASRR
jgi:hypothetical protein